MSRTLVARGLIAVAALAVVAFGVYWWTYGRYFESTDDAYVRADSSVISPRVGGEIVAEPVRENQAVHRGDVLVRIDPSDYQARVDNAQAAVAAAQAALQANVEQVRLQQSSIGEAQATLDAARADQQRLDKDWQRAKQLVGEGVATAQRLDTATAAYKAGRATIARDEAALAAARQQVVATEAEAARLQSQIKAQQATLNLARIDLESTTLKAPIDGSVGDLAVHLGERVAAGERLMTLVPLQAVYVEANYKETQLTHMALGQPASVSVDAFPGQTITGHLDSLSPASGAEFSLLPPQNATGNFTKIVQRVPVRIALDPHSPLIGKLRPGMSVVVDIDTRSTAKPAAKPADD